MADPTLISLPPALTLAEASATLARLAPQLQAAEAPVLDAAALTELDTSALAVLLECGRQAAARGRTLRVAHAPAKLVQLACLYGVDGLLAL
jgi:phospholipid transport system transporter-binding protein